MKLKRLPDTELEVMKALWNAGENVNRAALGEALAPYGWAVNTINTYLTRLEKKGFVNVEHDRRGNRYTPLVSWEEYQTFDSKEVLKQLYGSPRNFVAALARNGINKQELIQLRSLLDELEEESRNA